jgi:GDP-mannose pyrophosphatase NudK
MSTIDLINRKILSNGKYQLEEVTFTKPGLDGNKHEQKNEIYFRPDAVAVLLVDKQNEEFILTRQIRLATYLNPHDSSDGYLLEACAGLVEEGEEPELAVIREAEEETGFNVNSPNRIGGIYTSAGGITEYLHLFISEVSEDDQSGEGGGAEGEGEDIKIVRLSFSDAAQKIRAGEINDAKTLMLLQYYFLYNS